MSEVTHEGVVISRKIGGETKVLSWDDIDEWKIEDTVPFLTHRVILKSGTTVTLPNVDYDAATEALKLHRIPCSRDEGLSSIDTMDPDFPG